MSETATKPAPAKPAEARDERTHNQKLGVEPGDLVLWYPDRNRNQTPTPAMVSAVNPDTLHLHLFAQNSYSLPIRDGVRHFDDPRASSHEVRDEGVWDFTPKHKAMAEVLRQLGAKK